MCKRLTGWLVESARYKVKIKEKKNIKQPIGRKVGRENGE